MRPAGLEELRTIATQARAAIAANRATLGEYWSQMDHFPHGCCDISSSLLARFLIEVCGIGPIHRINGCRDAGGKPPWETHAWIEHRDVIVDITADQFEDSVDEPVRVTTSREWHDRFVGGRPGCRYEKSNLSGKLFDPMFAVFEAAMRWRRA